LRGDATPGAFYGKMAEHSGAKDTSTGHWEMTGIITKKPFPTYPNGFPEEVIEKFTGAIDRPVLGNKPASGTEIIKELGEEHIRTGNPIVYTSADSVFQIAACEAVIPVEELYDMCKTARGILTGRHNVGRVIARPFVVSEGRYVRTERRKDFSVPPPRPTLLDVAKDKNLEVTGVGKIGDIFAHTGLTRELHTGNNHEGVDQTINCIKKGDSRGIIFTNLIDFDMKYGHRNNPEGYARCLEEFDVRLPEILDALRDDDILSMTADHGCDPTTPSTDHSREYVPLLVYGRSLGKARSLGVRRSFSDLGATVAEALGLPPLAHGTSFYGDMFQN
ncbi:MAG: phosphopentomutase, partial [Candidatus Brocadiales bacterium]